MNNINYITGLITVAALFVGCQKNATDNNTQPAQKAPVLATISDQPLTRAQVEYGNNDPAKGELFMWNRNDQLRAFDLDKNEASATPFFYDIDDKYDDNNPSNTVNFYPYINDQNLVDGHVMGFYRGNNSLGVSIVNNNIEIKGIMTANGAVETSRIQIQQATPGNADLAHIKGYMSLYAFSTVSQGNVSELKFKHLSSMFRYSITNKTTTDLKVKRVLVTTINNHFVGRPNVTIDKAGNIVKYVVELGRHDHSLYFNDNLDNHYATIAASGGSYDSYSIFMPNVNINYGSGEKLSFTIDILDNGSDITLGPVELDASEIAARNGGVRHFEMGKRYWFDLTVDTDGTLKWTKDI